MTGRSCVGWLLFAGLLLNVGHADAQDDVSPVRELYEAAAFEDVLATTERIPAAVSSDTRATELRKYRALSLLALERNAAAEEVVEEMIVIDPRYRPDPQDSPRWKEAVEHAVSKIAPTLIRSRYMEGKRHFDQSEFMLATAEFDIVLTLLDNPALDRSVAASMTDIRTLSQGFLDLARSATAKTEAVPVDVPAGTPPVVLPGWIGQFTRFTIYTSGDAGVMPPVAVRQDLPEWPRQLRGSFEGELHVTVSETGAVESAVLRRPLHALYDSVLLEAAKTWKYQPAVKNGSPVKFRQVLKVTILLP
jgi:Gram-negative bacterial TonB protein C-terminal